MEQLSSVLPAPQSLVNVDQTLSLKQRIEAVVERVFQKSGFLREQGRRLGCYLVSGFSLVGAALVKGSSELWQEIFYRIQLIFKGRVALDEANLLSGKEKLSPFHHEWALNLALLREAEKSATSEPQREQIRFLMSNYLGRAAPVFTKYLQYIHPDIANQYQINGVSDYFYHRTLLHQNTESGAALNASLVLPNESPLVVTNTTEFAHLLPLKFDVMEDAQTATAMRLAMQEKVMAHFRDHPIKSLEQGLERPFLFDLTEMLGPLMKSEEAFTPQFAHFKAVLNEAMSEMVSSLMNENPLLRPYEKKISKWLKEQIHGVCRLELPPVAGLKILPLHGPIKSIGELPYWIEFCDYTGIVIGAVDFRRYLRDDPRPDIQYAVQTSGDTSLIRYYQTKESFMQTALIQRLSSSFAALEKPHLRVLGKGTLDLLTGLMGEISEETWERLHADPVYCQIMQAALFKIREHLAMAELYIDNFGAFAEKIELVHAEMSTLLELTRPFEAVDFKETYAELVAEQLPRAEDEETPPLSLFTGLGKTAINLFAGINAAIMGQNHNVQRCYSEGCYFEQAFLIGSDHTFEKIEANLAAPKIDLYVGQFSPNIAIDPSLTEYKRRDVIQDVRHLLDHGKAADHLTVAIDATIDKFHSENEKALLEAFKEEIRDGRLNFIFFHSGQKLDMFGMDNYYGAPFYMVNNGSEVWDSFQSLLTAPVHRTDPLSLQWFNLSLKYAKDSLAKYRELIFDNTRYILDRLPDGLKPSDDQGRLIKINEVDPQMEATFIDLKCLGAQHELRSYVLTGRFLATMFDKKIKAVAQASFGFYHVNCLTISAHMGESSTIRINPGINPEESEAIIDFFTQLAAEQ